MIKAAMRTYKLMILFAIAGAILYFSSGHKVPTVRNSIKLSGKNRMELYNVLLRYEAHPKDSLKLRAAKFLIRNMQYKYKTYCGTAYRHSDLQSITARHITQNIDAAFEAWQKPWASHLSFDEFCEYILPYRNGEYVPEDWREFCTTQLSPFLGSNTQTALDACELVNNRLINSPDLFSYLYTDASVPYPGNGLMVRTKNECSVNRAAYAMRSMGIPVAIEFIPGFMDKKGKYIYNVVYNNDKKYYDFVGGVQNPCNYIESVIPIPKVFRKTYAVQDNALALMNGQEEIPDLFKDPCLKDVTANYPFIQPQELRLEITSDRPKKNFIYLCIIADDGLQPVDWCKVKRNFVHFRNIGPGIIYQVAYYENGEFYPLGYSYQVTSKGERRMVRKIGLTRKS